MITSLPGAIAMKPGSATLPVFGVQPEVLEPATGQVIEGNGVEGVLAIRDSWPGQMRTVWGDHARFVSTYFEHTRATTSPVTAAAATRTAITGSRAGSTT